MSDIIVGFDGNWEKMKYISDLPSWVQEDIEEYIVENLNKILPFVCVDIDID
jgi:hypothetical protein